MKFKYKNKVKVLYGFYEGYHGFVKDYKYQYNPYNKDTYIYSVEIDDLLIKFDEEELELL